ncbi:DUF342 domain-containing protein [Fictibacillus barbaricus]|uniref:DUF342 domain-containing protein n=1 Tax=Fictibacillus barbaricus TaxID=182136 RepID=A0ABS2ZEQ8_9BACL|nr:FapA family protein [Fictibacillus barbaricus]MBN3545822.1 DUF342 domain-containing protein [Fictibacillus barbaricus]GGB56401.1 hypothetical protein GCM10007199_22840 [Fictibacillus barbaricus]
MDQWFSIKVEESDMRALLFKKEDIEIPSEQRSLLSLTAWIESKGIRHGIRHEVLKEVVENLDTFLFPAEIAIGKLPTIGEAAQLIPSCLSERHSHTEDHEKIDLKRLFIIPTATAGELVARKTLATDGIPGITVFGDTIPAQKGKDISIQNGQNTVFDKDDLCVYATTSGEVTYKKNCVNIYPVFKVQGDVSLKTGHIDFVGNVHITGDVPSGFKIQAKGDVRIEGVVEAAEIISQGNVIIGGGVLGQGKGSIRCDGNFTSLYINQGKVFAGENIEVVQTILHSYCEAGQNITCLSSNGNIAGGTCIAGNEIAAYEIGNETYSKTLIYIKGKDNDQKVSFEDEQKIIELQQNLEKLQQLKAVMEQRKMEQLTIMKIVNTINQSTSQLTVLYKEKEKMRDRNQLRTAVTIKGTLHPNVEIGIGKYKRKVQSPYSSARVSMEEKEIIIHSL